MIAPANFNHRARSLDSLYELDLLARGGTLTLLALWSVLLIRDHWAALSARVAVAMNVAIACHVMADAHGRLVDGSVELILLRLGQATAPGWFWLFARVWFNDERKISWRSVALIASLVAMEIVHLWARITRPPFMPLVDYAMRVAWISFAMAGLWVAWRGRNDDLVESRRRLRFWFVLAIGGYIALIAAFGLIVNDWGGPNRGFTIINLGVPVLTGILCAIMFGIRRDDLFVATEAAAPPGTPVDDVAQDALALRLQIHMQSERPYRDETMTIAKLAGQLGEQEYRLRRLINGRLGHRNFAAFLNGYRLDEVKAALADAEQREVPILTMALDAGFGSLGPFNRAFREAEGMTPTVYRATHAA
jgi:AraC-like DNA-binding protein